MVLEIPSRQEGVKDEMGALLPVRHIAGTHPWLKGAENRLGVGSSIVSTIVLCGKQRPCANL